MESKMVPASFLAIQQTEVPFNQEGSDYGRRVLAGTGIEASTAFTLDLSD